MSTSKTKYTILWLSSTLVLGGCGSGLGGCNDKTEEVISGPEIYSNTNGSEAPQYMEPTMANLQGRPQQFPSRYPCAQYPNSRVVMAYVKPNLKPGQKNIVLLSSSDQKPNIAVFYKKDMIANGWEMTNQYENSCFSRTVWRKKTINGIQEAEVRVSPDPYHKQAVQLLTGPYRPRLDYNDPKAPHKW
jgi:hypothetical protein